MHELKLHVVLNSLGLCKSGAIEMRFLVQTYIKVNYKKKATVNPIYDM